jgi:FixJ family two-component response regulator
MLAARPNIRVVFMSGYNDTNSVRRGEVGADRIFLQKPFTRAELASVVRNALDAPAPLSQNEARVNDGQ